MAGTYDEIILVNPNTGQSEPVLGLFRDKINQLLESGYVPKSEGDANTLNDLNYNVPTTNYNGQDIANIWDMGGIDRSRVIGSGKAADLLMEGYREFGEDNPYLNQAYGTNNPYLEKAMGGIGKLEDMAYSKELTPYAEALLDEQNLIKSMQGEDVRRTSAGNMANTMSGLAMAGGLDTGARERALLSGGKNTMSAMQNLSAQDALARNKIMSSDVGYRQNLASQIPGMYNPYAQGAEDWRQKRALGQEAYAQEREKQKYATMGNIYGGENV